MNKNEKKLLFSKFIEYYFILLNMIKEKFNNNVEFKTFYAKNILLKKTNIKLFIRTWYEYITVNYKKNIYDGNIDFFLTNANSIIGNEYFTKYFHYFKEVFDTLEKNTLSYVVYIVQQLTQLSENYYK